MKKSLNIAHSHVLKSCGLQWRLGYRTVKANGCNHELGFWAGVHGHAGWRNSCITRRACYYLRYCIAIPLKIDFTVLWDLPEGFQPRRFDDGGRESACGNCYATSCSKGKGQIVFFRASTYSFNCRPASVSDFALLFQSIFASHCIPRCVEAFYLPTSMLKNRLKRNPMADLTMARRKQRARRGRNETCWRDLPHEKRIPQPRIRARTPRTRAILSLKMLPANALLQPKLEARKNRGWAWTPARW